MALTTNNRSSCQIIVQELQDNVRAFETLSTQISGHQNQIERINENIRQLEFELLNSEHNNAAQIRNQIANLENQRAIQEASLEHLKQQRSFTKNIIDRLSDDYDQTRCNQFFAKPSLSRYI